MNDHHRHTPFVIPVFIPHAGCPHQCLFCDQTRTTNRDRTFPTESQIDAEINRFLSYRRDHRRWTEISFFGGNFLGLSDSQIMQLLTIADRYIQTGRAQGIRFSTRPDTIDEKRVALIRDYPISTIEIGAQSMNASVLAMSRRGHSPDDTIKAVKLLKNNGFRTGLQMMVGLPAESEQAAVTSAQQMAGLAPDFVRIYPCLVLRGSPLARWYSQGRFVPLSLEKSVSLVKRIYSLMTVRGITVIRMGLQPTTELNSGAGVLAGPFHPAYGELVYSALWMDALRRTLSSHNVNDGNLTIEIHPKAGSRIRGHRRCNLKRLRREYHLTRIKIVPDSQLPRDLSLLNGVSCPLIPDE
jgi:histone acetyltransferase (RNA polymerase elongator complex component)